MVPIDRHIRRSRAIPLTPLIDVVFLLMVFFILTTHYVKVEALRLGTLEEAVPAYQQTAQTATHHLVLLGSGVAFLNNKLVYHGDLENALDVLFVRQPGARMTLQCDGQVSVQALVDVLDMIKRVGGGDVRVSRWQERREPL